MSRSFRALLRLLLLALVFLAGRAYGWYEADQFMEEVARSLGVVVEDN